MKNTPLNEMSTEELIKNKDKQHYNRFSGGYAHHPISAVDLRLHFSQKKTIILTKTTQNFRRTETLANEGVAKSKTEGGSVGQNWNAIFCLSMSFLLKNMHLQRYPNY